MEPSTILCRSKSHFIQWSLPLSGTVSAVENHEPKKFPDIIPGVPIGLLICSWLKNTTVTDRPCGWLNNTTVTDRPCGPKRYFVPFNVFCVDLDMDSLICFLLIWGEYLHIWKLWFSCSQSCPIHLSSACIGWAVGGLYCLGGLPD